MTSKPKNNVWRAEQATLLRLKGRLIYVLFAAAILLAMGGWLYFIGRISWRFATWIFG